MHIHRYIMGYMHIYIHNTAITSSLQEMYEAINKIYES